MKKKKYLVIIGHPDKKSFCYNGIFKTIIRTFNKYNQEYKVIDLYEDKLHRDKTDMIQDYKNSVTWATHLYFISPVWWFRLTPKTETFFDEVFTPGFAYNFVPIVGT
jgi:putative NADPH-quinone reductase